MQDDAHDRHERNRHTNRTDASGGWRAEYTAQGATIPDGGRYLLPERGARVGDREAEDNAELVVLEVYPDTTAAGYPIGALDGTTVAEVNPEYDPSAPVIEAVYLDEVTLEDDENALADLRKAVDAGSVTAYSFPVDRLTRFNSEDTDSRAPVSDEVPNSGGGPA